MLLKSLNLKDQHMNISLTLHQQYDTDYYKSKIIPRSCVILISLCRTTTSLPVQGSNPKYNGILFDLKYFTVRWKNRGEMRMLMDKLIEKHANGIRMFKSYTTTSTESFGTKLISGALF